MVALIGGSLFALALTAPMRAPPRPALQSCTLCRSTVPHMVSPGVGLVANAAVETLNGIFYISPLRNTVIKSLFGVAQADIYSPISGAFMFLGGLHAAVAIQCWAALMGLRSARETLLLMVGLHTIQGALGVFRALKTTLDGKLATPTIDAFLGAGGGPAIGAFVLGALSWAAA